MKTIGIFLGKQHYNQAWNKFVNQQNPHCNRLTSYLQTRTQKKRVVHFFFRGPKQGETHYHRTAIA
jgi:pyoverdine/dityrosine biosynthesis protein Dit1